MKALIKGYRYELGNFETPSSQGQVVQFIHKENKLKDISEVSMEQVLCPGSDNFKLVTISNGTTNEEVLEMLIDRINFLNTKNPCRENSIVITNLETALLWLEKRTKDRIQRGVESKNEK